MKKFQSNKVNIIIFKSFYDTIIISQVIVFFIELFLFLNYFLILLNLIKLLLLLFGYFALKNPDHYIPFKYNNIYFIEKYSSQIFITFFWVIGVPMSLITNTFDVDIKLFYYIIHFSSIIFFMSIFIENKYITVGYIAFASATIIFLINIGFLLEDFEKRLWIYTFAAFAMVVFYLIGNVLYKRLREPYEKFYELEEQYQNLLEDKIPFEIPLQNITVICIDITGVLNYLMKYQSISDVNDFIKKLIKKIEDLQGETGVEIRKEEMHYFIIRENPRKSNPHYSIPLIEFCLDLLKNFKLLCSEDNLSFNFRIGMDSGKYIDYSVPLDREVKIHFIYAAFVRAALMEKHGVNGEIQATNASYEMLKEKYQFIERAEIPLNISNTSNKETVYLLKQFRMEL